MKLIMENWRGYFSRGSKEKEEEAGPAPAETEDSPEASTEDPNRDWDNYQGWDTVGDVRNAIKKARKAKLSAQGKGEFGKAAVDTAVGAIPVIGNILAVGKSLAGVIQKSYHLDDTEVEGSGLEYLNVDRMISQIIDDKVENRFLNNYLRKFEKKDPNTRLDDIDMTKELIQFIKDEYSRIIYNPDEQK